MSDDDCYSEVTVLPSRDTEFSLDESKFGQDVNVNSSDDKRGHFKSNV